MSDFIDIADVVLHGPVLAVPSHRLDQNEVKHLSAQVFADKPALFARLAGAYDNAGVKTRWSCVPGDWYLKPHGWRERSRLFEENALILLEQAASHVLEEAGIAAGEVAAIVSVTSTGIVTPTLDALLADKMEFSDSVVRLPVFGLGCAGGVSGLARAADMARAMRGRPVLLLVVELCALTFRSQDLSKGNVIAAALFGDGAAAMILIAGEDLGNGEAAVRLGPSGEHQWPDSRDVMGWRVEEDGLGVVFSRDIPSLIRSRLRPVLDDFLARHGGALNDLDGFLCHPGGPKVMAALAECLDCPPAALEHSKQALSDYGNMSAVSVLAVLARARAQKASGRHLMVAFGPGFTASMLLLDLG